MDPFHSNQQAAQPNAGGGGQAVARVKGAWSAEEDHVLKKRMEVHGEGSWAAIAMGLPGRTGKQCRERWMNNLRPDIKKKEIWTEEEETALINAHKFHGNRWSVIATCLTGRSENEVKNHWSATRRSLGAKRRLRKKKSEQLPDGQFSLLEEYIRSLYPEPLPVPTESEQQELGNLGLEGQVFANTILAPPVSVGMSMNATNLYGEALLQDLRSYEEPQMLHGGLIYPNVLASSASYYNPPDMGIYTNPTNLAGTQAMQPYLNAYTEPQAAYCPPSFTNHLNPDPAYCPLSFTNHLNHPFQPQINTQDPQGNYINLGYPSAENVLWQSSNQGHASGFYGEAGPSSAGADAFPDDIDIVEEASRQFFIPSEADAILDLSKFL